MSFVRLEQRAEQSVKFAAAEADAVAELEVDEVALAELPLAKDETRVAALPVAKDEMCVAELEAAVAKDERRVVEPEAAVPAAEPVGPRLVVPLEKP